MQKERYAALVLALALCGGLIGPARANRVGTVAGDPAPPAGGTPTTTTSGTPDTTQPKQPANGLIEDSDAAWVWSGMTEYDDELLHGKTGRCGGPGTYGTFTFHGTAVDVYGMTAPAVVVDNRSRKLGKARIVLDGKDVGVATTSSSDTDYDANLCHVANLPAGNHVIQIHAEDGWVVIDYLKVVDTPVGSADDSYKGPSVLPAGDYAIFPRHAPDKCLEVSGLTDRSPAEIYTPTSGRYQVWHITPLGKERYRISPTSAPSEALTVIGPRTTKTSTIISGMIGLYPYVGDPSQQWVLSPVDDHYCQLLVAAQVVAALDVDSFGNADGTDVIAYPNKETSGQPAANQQWTFRRIQ